MFKNKEIIYGLMFALNNKIQAMANKEFKDITVKQHFLLVCISQFKKAPTLKELSDLMGTSYQNVKIMSNNLEKKGYVKIEVDPKDKRKYKVILTEKINLNLDYFTEISNKFFNDLFKDIKEDDIEVCMKTLMKMNENIGAETVEK